MRDNTFTPGPWSIRLDENTHFIEAPDRGYSPWVVAEIMNDIGYEKDGAEANARLIAAAPDLYNALWEVVEISDRNLTEAGRTPECQKVYDLCLAALKKAEGE